MIPQNGQSNTFATARKMLRNAKSRQDDHPGEWTSVVRIRVLHRCKFSSSVFCRFVCLLELMEIYVLLAYRAKRILSEL